MIDAIPVFEAIDEGIMAQGFSGNFMLEDPLGHKVGKLSDTERFEEINSKNDMSYVYRDGLINWELYISRPLPGLYKVTYEGVDNGFDANVRMMTYSAAAGFKSDYYYEKPEYQDYLENKKKVHYELFVPVHKGSIGDVNRDANLTEDDLIAYDETTDRDYYTDNLFSDPKDINKDGIINNVDREQLIKLIASYQAIDFSKNKIEAVDDSVETEQNKTVEIKVLDNDIQPSGSKVKVSVETNPVNGSVKISDNIFKYTPKAGFYGDDEFSYKVCLENNICDSATVKVKVNKSECSLEVHRFGDNWGRAEVGQIYTFRWFLRDKYFFRLKKDYKGMYGLFPLNKKDNYFWQYLGKDKSKLSCD